MIDIHSHVLWGMDDGAETREETLALLQMAAEHGTTEIVATPHADFDYAYQPDLVAQRLADVSAASGGRPVLHRGCDFHLSFENVQDALAVPERYTIDSGPYLLVEFPDHLPPGMGKVLATLQQRGLVPIMTHPERHVKLREIPGEFVEWIRQGCLVQVTAQSLLGRFGKRAEESAWQMIGRGLAHFVASDAHDLEDRVPRLDTAFDAVTQRASRDVAERLFVTNPKSAVSGTKIDIVPPPRKRWYQFGG
jgi:protein-tyrosine phosphatase